MGNSRPLRVDRLLRAPVGLVQIVVAAAVGAVPVGSLVEI